MSDEQIQCGICGHPGVQTEMVEQTVHPEHPDQAEYSRLVHAEHLEEPKVEEEPPIN